MSLPALWQTSSNYKVSTEVYEGPLDLLLQLIEQAQLDITKISLAMVTDQYLQHMQSQINRDPIEVSAFLVIAAKLVYLKSIILLPSMVVPDEINGEDFGDQLVTQLLVYKQFKEKVIWLRERQLAGLKSYYRLAKPLKIIEKLDLNGIEIDDLVEILLGVYFQNEYETPLSDVVVISRITIHNKIEEIIRLFKNQRTRNFSSLIEGEKNRLDLVVTFLALLELIKNYSIQANQENLFGEIYLESTENLETDFETEL